MGAKASPAFDTQVTVTQSSHKPESNWRCSPVLGGALPGGSLVLTQLLQGCLLPAYLDGAPITDAQAEGCWRQVSWGAGYRSFLLPPNPVSSTRAGFLPTYATTCPSLAKEDITFGKTGSSGGNSSGIRQKWGEFSSPPNKGSKTGLSSGKLHSTVGGFLLSCSGGHRGVGSIRKEGNV